MLALGGLALHLAVAWPRWWFTVLPDEAGYLGNARWLTGGPSWPMGAAPRYGIVSSVLYVPAVLLGNDAGSVVRLAALTNAAVLACLAPLLAVAVRRLTRCAAGVALAAGGLGALVPGAVLGGTVMWAEPAVLVAVAGVAVGLCSPRVTPWFGVLVGAMPWIHLRLLPFVAVGLVWLVTRRAWRPLVAAVIVCGIGGAGQWAVERARWSSSVGPPLRTGLTRPGSALAQVAGEGWYLVAGTGGLVALGALALWREVRRGDRGALALAVSAAGLIGLSAVSSAASAHRPEQFVYGRYVDAVAPVLAALGAVWLLRSGAARRRSVALAVVGTLLAGLGIVLAVRGSAAFDGRWQSTQVIALAWGVGDGGARVLWVATAVAVGVVVVWGFAGARVGAGVLGCALVASSMGAWAGPLSDRRAQYDGWTVPETVAGLSVDRVAYDMAGGNPVGQWAYPLLFDDADYVLFSGDIPPGADAVVGSLDDPPVSGSPVVSDNRFGLGVWLVEPTG